MTQRIRALFSCGLIFAGCAHPRVWVGTLPETTQCIAVAPFEMRFQTGSRSEMLSEFLALDLFNKGNRGVLGPQELAKLFRDANDPLPPVIDPYWARELGRKLKVDAVLFGSVSHVPMYLGSEATDGEAMVGVDAFLLHPSSGAIGWVYSSRRIVPMDDVTSSLAAYSDEMTQTLLSSRPGGVVVGKPNCWNAPAKVEVAQVALAAAPIPLTASQEAILQTLTGGKPSTLDASIFEGRGEKLTKESVKSLRDVSTVLAAANAPKRLTIRAHLDATDNPAEDLELSRLRANALKRYLVTLGIDEARLQAEGFGSTMPLIPNLNEKGRRLNRRVEIVSGDSETP